MTVEEIFGKINQHMIEGLMVHSQMSDYFNFLGLEGYSKCHLYHFYEESMNFRCINDYYLRNYSKLILEMPTNNPKMIPADWYKYTRQQVDIGTRKTSISAAAKKWVDWEYNTKTLYQQMYQELMAINEVAGAIEVKKLIEDVSEEYAIAVQKMIELKSIDYDMAVILEEQSKLENCYDKKIKKLFL